jgi:hypothetical protein
MSKKTCYLFETHNSLERIKKNPKKLVLAGVIDVLFFIMYGFLTAPLFRKLIEYVIIIGTEISQNAASIARGENPTLGSMIAGSPEMTQYFRNMMLVYLLLAIVIYIIYVFFHGTAWKISSDIAGRKIRFYEYLKEFAVVNIFWIILLVVYHLLSLYSDLSDAAARSMQAEPGNVFWIIIAVLYVTTFYFAAISYALIGKVKKGKVKKAFAIGTKNAKQVLPAYLLVLLVFFVLRFVLNEIAEFDFWIMLIIGLFTMIPAFTWARVYFTMVVEKNVRA